MIVFRAGTVMRRKITKTYDRNVQKKKTKTNADQHFEDFQNFTSELFKDNVSKVENNLRKVLNMKNDSITELKEELKECKITVRKRDEQIKMLDNEKEVFNQIIEKQNLTNQISEQERKLRYYEKHIAENKSKTNDKDDWKIRKLVKKCKDLKVKVKSRDFELFQKEMEKKDLKKLIDVKDDEIKKRDMEILNFDKKFNEKEAISFSLESMHKRNADLEEELLKKNVKIEEMQVQAMKDDRAIEVMKKHSDALNEELRKLK